ncbi:MAG TPA: NAD(+) synthase [Acidobacteriota bacterium]|nr:NAD(+) synthase [Acidobacteriota bacterium]
MALGQINPKTGDIQGNVEKILRFAKEAAAKGCHLIAFPEMAVPGYCLDEKLMMNRRFLAENKQAVMEQVAPASRKITIITGFLDFDTEALGPDESWVRYNAAAICQNGQCIQIAHKTLLPNYRYFEDRRYFCPGRPAPPFELTIENRRIKVGVEICEDLWEENYPIKPTQQLVEHGSQVIVCINASPYVCASPGQRDGKIFRRRELVLKQVRRHGVPIAYINTVGVGDNGKNVIPFDGGSFAVDSQGRMIQMCRQFEEELGVATLNVEDGSGSPMQEPCFHREGEIYAALCMAVRDYYQKLGIFTGILQSLSGGIDSALGTCIAVDAMGKEKVAAISMPSKHSSANTQEIARTVARNLAIEHTVMPIQEIVDRIVETYRRSLGDFGQCVSVENIQARVRGILLMARSNDRRELLLSNGNETEIALGYSTLYGDMCGGLSVIGDLSKLDVYRLARYVNQSHDPAIIPEAAFTIAPSAELAAGQVDPFDYAVVSPLIGEFIEKRRTAGELVQMFEQHALDAARFPPDSHGGSVYDRYSVDEFAALVKKTYVQLNRSVYKRLQGPPIIVISERAFGFDLRETLLNFWE